MRPSTAGTLKNNITAGNPNYRQWETLARPKSINCRSNAGLRVASKKALLQAFVNKTRTKSVANGLVTQDIVYN